ncbi:unnamed protein product [Linum tenue]|uniref:non-specific serine/threonine protein kinase n=1 Tax=Linum tenue TaxID=586396 RepID=A0AAV0K0V8_9ROSI|nr:unnamed protein product [Linum tenue]
MKNAPSPAFLRPIVAFSAFAALAVLFCLPLLSHALGSGSTLAVISGSPTACGIVSYQATQSIVCFRPPAIVTLQPNISFSSISGGQDFFCGVRSGGYALLCWDTFSPVKRIYFNTSVLLQSVSVGGDRVCSTTAAAGTVRCWRGDESSRSQLPPSGERFSEISSGYGFSCGISVNGSRIRCWGSQPIAQRIESGFGSMSMLSVQAGGSHVCGVNSTGFVVCRGDNSSGQLNAPLNSPPLEYSQLALGANYSCALRRSNGSVVCWGGDGGLGVNGIEGIFFESIVSGSNFLCGILSNNLSTICWGPGWPSAGSNSNSQLFQVLPLPPILPGPCVESSSCGECGVYGDSQNWCGGSGVICRPCGFNAPSPPFPPSQSPISPPPPSSSTTSLRKGLLSFAIVGSLGAFAGICTVFYCLWTGACLGRKKVHNSVQPTITRAGSNNGGGSNNSNNSGSSTIRRQSSKAMRRQRSGTSSKHAEPRAEEFTLSELAAATDGFAAENKIGAGSYGIVYRGKLADGREVAIKRGETSKKAKKYQEKESAFESELSFLSRLHHKHLVRLVGYCDDGGDEKLLVYEYMKNGALYDHLHDRNNVENSSSLINSWKIRIRIALDAARGIEYLHNYAVPPIIHRDIKSSNILLDGNWVARVSDFGLSLLGPDPEREYRPTKAAGTVGYIDPEYYSLNVLTAKSDVYGLGVVLLELLTGKRAIFKGDDGEGTPTSIVEYAVARIAGGELWGILDRRVGQPDVNESEAVELVGYTAMHCVRPEGKDRPTMADIVVNLERALVLCEGSHGSISSGTISIVSE